MPVYGHLATPSSLDPRRTPFFIMSMAQLASHDGPPGWTPGRKVHPFDVGLDCNFKSVTRWYYTWDYRTCVGAGRDGNECKLKRFVSLYWKFLAKGFHWYTIQQFHNSTGNFAIIKITKEKYFEVTASHFPKLPQNHSVVQVVKNLIKETFLSSHNANFSRICMQQHHSWVHEQFHQCAGKTFPLDNRKFRLKSFTSSVVPLTVWDS